jgi:CRISPR-associated endonuclease Cas2
MNYIMLCYDIHKNNVRQKLYKYLLKIEGIPMQKSVFIIPHNRKNKKTKIQWIVDQILPKLSVQDQIHIVPLSKDKVSAIISLKTVTDLSFMTEDEIVII